MIDLKEPKNCVMPQAGASDFTVCSHCVMDTTDPSIAFDQSGTCNHCLDYRTLVEMGCPIGVEARDQLAAIIAEIKRNGTGKRYDCIVGISGGVDSTFALWKAKEMGLRPLAVHLDNGWNSEAAVRNIQNALKTLGVDLHTEVLDWEEFRDIQLAFLRASTPDAEIPTDHAIFATIHHLVKRMGVQYSVTGLNIRTETHMPPAWSQGHRDWGYIKAIHRQFGSRRRIRRFPHFKFYEGLALFNRGDVQTINILNYLDYSKSDALKILPSALGWKDYGGKHNESIYTRWYQGYYLLKKFGFDKRKAHLSSRICAGELTREQAIRELSQPAYPEAVQKQDCEYVSKKLGLTKLELDRIMEAAPRKFEEFPSYAKARKSAWFLRATNVYRFFKNTILRRGS